MLRAIIKGVITMAMYKPVLREKEIDCVKNAFEIDMNEFKTLLKHFNACFLKKVYFNCSTTLNTVLYIKNESTVKLGCGLCGEMAKLLMGRTEKILKSVNADPDGFLLSLGFNIIYMPKIVKLMKCFSQNNRLKSLHSLVPYIFKNCEEFPFIFKILSDFNNLAIKLEVSAPNR